MAPSGRNRERFSVLQMGKMGSIANLCMLCMFSQWEFQDPKMEVLYHIRPYFVGIFPYIGLKNRPYIWNRYLQSIGSCCMANDKLASPFPQSWDLYGP